MRADDIDLLGRQAGPFESQLHALRLPLGVGQHEVGRVGVHRVADDLAVDLRAARLRVAQPLQHEHAAAFGHDDAVAVQVEGPGGLRRVVVFGQRALAAKAGKDPERVDALRHAAGQRHVALAQPQHLHALDQPGVARGTGGPDRVVRAGDPQVQRDLAGRVVGHGARVVVVRPELRVVVVPFEFEDLVLGLDVAVLGHAQIDADPRRVDVRPIESRVVDRLVGAVHADAAGAGAATQVLA